MDTLAWSSKASLLFFALTQQNEQILVYTDLQNGDECIKGLKWTIPLLQAQRSAHKAHFHMFTDLYIFSAILFLSQVLEFYRISKFSTSNIARFTGNSEVKLTLWLLSNRYSCNEGWNISRRKSKRRNSLRNPRHIMIYISFLHQTYSGYVAESQCCRLNADNVCPSVRGIQSRIEVTDIATCESQCRGRWRWQNSKDGCISFLEVCQLV